MFSDLLIFFSTFNNSHALMKIHKLKRVIGKEFNK